jgi:hypothetical protein
MEVGTALAILGSVTASKELLLRVLGPTADYFGEQLADLVENLNPRRRETLAKILARARTINDAQGDDSAESEVPPRVFRNIIDEGTYVDDALAAEYLGGLLASSKVPYGRDNGGSSYLHWLTGCPCIPCEHTTYCMRPHAKSSGVITPLSILPRTPRSRHASILHTASTLKRWRSGQKKPQTWPPTMLCSLFNERGYFMTTVVGVMRHT